jgi:excisionase family DNA binding protein
VKEYYGYAEVAEMFEVNLNTIKGWVRYGKLGSEMVGNRRMIPHHAVLELCKQILQVEGYAADAEKLAFKRRLKVYKRSMRRMPGMRKRLGLPE